MADSLERLYADRLPILNALEAAISSSARDCLRDQPHVDRITTRVKGVDRFLEKAGGGRYSSPLEEIEDQIGLRILVFFRADIEQVTARLRDWFPPVEDFLHEPERDVEFGYLTHHFVFVIPEHLKPAGWSEMSQMPTTFEAQVRTLFMHAYAEPNHLLSYENADDLPREIRRQLAWIAASAWGADQAYDRVLALMEDGTS